MRAQVLAFLLMLAYAYTLMLGVCSRSTVRAEVVCALPNDTTALSFPNNYTEICRERLERIYLGSPMSDLDLE